MESKTQTRGMVPIWFFIGINVLVYGIAILATGIIGWSSRPSDPDLARIHDLHPDVWWGAFMLAIGLFYTIRFWPSRSNPHDAEPPSEDNIAAKGTKWD